MKPLSTYLRKQIAPLSGLFKAAPVRHAVPQLEILPVKPRRVVSKKVVPPQETFLHITCPDPTDEDGMRDEHIKRGLHLARQERWDDLITLIEEADASRQMTVGTMPVAELFAFGARSDVVMAAEHALFDGSPAKDAHLLAGIEALEHVLADHPESYVVACIVAQAHIDIGWAWRGNRSDIEVPQRNREAFNAHFDRAADIVAEFSSIALDRPFLAATRCALLGSTGIGNHFLADSYEKLIDLNPANPRPMRAMGNHLLPRWYGSYEALELEARRTAVRTQEVWGAGGYTWVQFDAIANDDEACARLDLDFFIEGMHDILSRKNDPYTTNLLAAYCSNSIGQSFSGIAEADHIRAQIADCASWIVRNHLTELHPMIWAHASVGFDNNMRVHSPKRFAAAGRDDAIRIITSMFSSEIAAGKRIVFTDNGPVAQAC